MSVLIEIKEGFYLNPNHIVSVDARIFQFKPNVEIVIAGLEENLLINPEQWFDVKPLLVARYAARPEIERESVTAKAVSEIITEEEDALMADYAIKQAGWHAELVREELERPSPATFDDFGPDDDEDDFEDDEEAAGPVLTDLYRLIQVVQSGDFVILDTETTGLYGDAEICQISIIDASGNTLLDTLVKPQKSIPADATRIHGITNDMVKNAPDWINVNEAVWQACKGKTVIVYNTEYDFKLITQSEKACKPLALSDWHMVKRECAMLAYAEYRGVWNEYHGNYKWHKLSDAAARVGYSLPAGMKAHSALADCLMTLAVCRKLAGL